MIARSYTMKVKCLFMLRFVSSGNDWKVTIWCRFNNHTLFKDLDENDILARLKYYEKKIVKDMTKYNMAIMYIVVALKESGLENLTSVTQVYRERSTCRRRKRGSLIEMQDRLSLIHEDKYMYWTRNMDSSNVIVDICFRRTIIQ